jgi:hypothetical protein
MSTLTRRRRVRLLLVAAVTVAALACAQSAFASQTGRMQLAPLASPLAPTLATGVLSEVAGGTVTVSLEPSGMKVGDPAQPSITVASAAVDANGQFSVQVDPSGVKALLAALAAARASNSGWINLDLVATGNGKMIYESISRQFVNGAWQGDNASASTAIAPAAPAVKIANAKRVTAATVCNPFTRVDAEGDTNTTIGELHTGDNQTAWFRYGQSADSSIEVGVQVPIGSSWSVSGSVHVGNSQSSYIQFNEGAQWGYKLRTNMHFKKIYHDWTISGCGGTPFYTSQASSWNSGSALGDNVHDLDNNCSTSPYKQSYVPNGDFQTTSETATWFTGAASAFGASLRAQSGFSNYVISHWHHGAAYPAYWHCGSDAMPNQSHRVYSGW